MGWEGVQTRMIRKPEDRPSSHDNRRHIAAQMWLEFSDGAERPGALQHDVHPGCAPGNVDGVSVLGERAVEAAESEAVSFQGSVALPLPMDRVELHEVGRSLDGAGDLVDMYDVEVVVMCQRPDNETTHAAEAIDADPSCHDAASGETGLKVPC